MKNVLRWIGRVLVGLVLIIALATGFLYFRGKQHLAHTYTSPSHLAALPADSATVARGAHLARYLGCQDCHLENYAGKVFLDIPPGLIVAPNLTPAGRGSAYETAQHWDAAIRYGIRPDGTSMLPFMPSEYYHRLSDEDAAALIAYLQHIPPVESELPETEVRFVGNLMTGAAGAMAAALLEAERPPMPSAGPTAAYGRYLTSLVCEACHGPELRGGPHPDPNGPTSPDLAASGRWTPAQFAHAMRTGTTPAGLEMDKQWMPWPAFSHLSEDELEAIRLHLATLGS